MPWWPEVAPPATSSRPWPSPRRWWTRGHDRGTIEFVGSTAGQDRLTLAGPGLPVHPAARTGHRPQPAPGRPGGQPRCAGSAWPWPRSGVGVVGRARPQVVVSVGGYASLAALDGRGGPAGPAGAGQRGCRARGGQPAARPVRPGQCGGVGGQPAAPGRGDRDAGATGDRRGWDEPAVTGARPGPSPRAARPTGPPWPCSAAPSGPAGSTGPSWTWPTGGRTGTTARSTTSSAAGTGRNASGRRGGESTAEGSTPRGLALVRVPYEERMDLVYAAADVVVCRAGAMTWPSWPWPGCRRSWCRCPGRRATTRRPTPGCWSGPGRPSCCPTAGATPTALATALDGAARRQPDPAGRHGPAAARRSAAPTPPPPGPGGRGQRRPAAALGRSAGAVSPTGGGPLLGDRERSGPRCTSSGSAAPA